jgi:hypothetical protein
MKRILIASIILLFSGQIWADSGPFYVTYPGYCNVKKVFVVSGKTDIYGTEIGCSALIGTPLIGSIASNGNVAVSTLNQGYPCIHSYWTDNTLHGGCSNGYGVSYAPDSVYGVRTSMSLDTDTAVTKPAVGWKLEQQIPDIEATKNLPALPF